MTISGMSATIDLLPCHDTRHNLAIMMPASFLHLGKTCEKQCDKLQL